MEKYLDSILRVGITDGRTIQGQLKCIDNSLNLILIDSVNVADGQLLGPVIIPGEHVKGCKLFVAEQDEPPPPPPPMPDVEDP